MIIPKETVLAVMSLDVKGIRDALRHNGYVEDAQQVKETKFLGMNNTNNFVYETIFFDPDSEDNITTTNIFVTISPARTGNTFVYLADY